MLSLSARPASPKPVTTLTTPAGMPASSSARPSSSGPAGASSEGLTTTALPAASAGATFLMVISSGWFHGVIWPTTPTGTRRT